MYFSAQRLFSYEIFSVIDHLKPLKSNPSNPHLKLESAAGVNQERGLLDPAALRHNTRTRSTAPHIHNTLTNRHHTERNTIKMNKITKPQPLQPSLRPLHTQLLYIHHISSSILQYTYYAKQQPLLSSGFQSLVE